ncbi:YbhB/YbcL family Raf kinase inhibitor-like protein SCDLUD_003863 [Saccharomycodes ludwigii]|uniref:YbhB/YbcL family Raf kinase inhibitor-like protein n=1 Tax=Saccharomycodes ludwigii TaxID=36035 RepID=UPI001E8638E4|nr:hypothetical protein SCDLUD_003863 [Saccharomycodes ludwigii]KAH3899583.1 hypothetical protein SCDLUD_003863 [Saccharomycodes ludwigii]
MNQALNVSKSVLEALSKHSIIPDVFPNTNSSLLPKTLLSVEYPGGLTVAMGNILPIDKTQSAPKFQLLSLSNNDSTVIDTSSKYTLVLTDPDAPSRTEKKWSEYCHWIVTDLIAEHGGAGGNDLVTINSNDKNAKTIIDYLGPAPPRGTGSHRYIFCLFKGVPTKYNPSSDNKRANWGYGTPATGVEKWSKDNGLELVGVNFFFAENK